jgi:hypothetical protein
LKDGRGRLSPTELLEGKWSEGPLTGTPKDILSKALQMGVSFHRGTALGERGGTFLSWGLGEKEKCSLFKEIFYEEFERYVKMAL